MRLPGYRLSASAVGGLRSRLSDAQAWALNSADALIRAARVRSEAGVDATRSPVQRPAAQRRLEELVYELLDAHERTARLAAGLEWDPEWLAHLERLRHLQRISREVLSAASNSPGPLTDSVH
jgi:DNA repair ATPase RecN